MNCSNCQATISCGCQVRTASDGKKVCSNCLASYEQQLKLNLPKPYNNLSIQG
jgi:hypothetical protein